MDFVERLTEIVSALDELKIPHLVMGGHAVRYYGFNRETTDYDFCLPIAAGEHLSDRLSRTALFLAGVAVEVPTWRGEDFRRFVLGLLPNGKEELLEFWLRNHLLDDFANLYRRREEGRYGERKVSFLSLPDLIRSKETEREQDWQDISFLEEILDARNIAVAKSGGDVVQALSGIRSVRGLESAVAAGLFANQNAAEKALQAASNRITQAFLLPFAPKVKLSSDDILLPPFHHHLTFADPCSTRHLALVEATRLRYKRVMQDRDRQEKNERQRLRSPS